MLFRSIDEVTLSKLNPLPNQSLEDWEVQDGAVALGPFAVEMTVDGSPTKRVMYRLSFREDGSDGRIIEFGDDRAHPVNVTGRVIQRDGVIVGNVVNDGEIHIRPMTTDDADASNIQYLELKPKSVKDLAKTLLQEWGRYDG